MEQKNIGEITSIAKVIYRTEADGTIVPMVDDGASEEGVCPVIDEDARISEEHNLRLHQFRIRLADTEDVRNKTSMLIEQRYSWRGYKVTPKTYDAPDRITFTSSEEGVVKGTVSVGIDSDNGLLVDELFRAEVDKARQRGGRVCEYTKLAFDPDVHNQEVLAAIFHISFMYSRYIHNCSDLFIEVNPRHRRYYEHMLGFKRLGDAVDNPRVNAPAVLLWLDLAYAEQKISELGGTKGASTDRKSLYPYFYSAQEEKGIIARLRAMVGHSMTLSSVLVSPK